MDRRRPHRCRDGPQGRLQQDGPVYAELRSPAQPHPDGAALPGAHAGPEKVDGQMVPPFQWLSFTLPINMTGQPAASIPAGWTDSGLPVGLQIVGRHLADESVLLASAAFETAAPWADRWPGLVTSKR